MNYPVGELVGKGNSPFDFSSKVQEFADKRFNGYVILSVRGHFIEDGIVFFREGTILGCIVECLAAERTVKGDEAFSFFLNETKGNGFFQVVSLERSQVDLVVAFDEKLLVSKIDLKDLPKMLPSNFLPKFEKPASSKSTLDAYGLSELK